MDELTGTITDIFIYPIKSCAAVSLPQATLTDLGLEWDRRWVIVDEQNMFQTQRQIPHLVWIEPHLDLTTSTMTLRAPSQPELCIDFATPEATTRQVTVWRDTVQAWDMGDAAAQWLDQFLQVPGKQFRLIQFDPMHPRISDPHWTGEGAQKSAHPFTDGFAVNVLSRRAVDELNIRLRNQGIDPVTIERFRANLILDNIPAHEEDLMQSIQITTPGGEISLELVKPCTRCAIPEIDPYTAIREPAVTQVLASYRQKPAMNHAICFGVNAVVRAGAGCVITPGPFEYQLHF